MENKNINTEKPKRSFWWMVGYIFTWLVFLSWVAIWYFGWYNGIVPDPFLMKLWVWIAVVAFIFMAILHVIIFRLKWEAREKWIKNLKRVWKIFWIFLLICLVLLIINMIYGKIQYSKIPEVNESMFQRSEHQTPLPDDEDALIQLKKLGDEYSKNGLWKDLDKLYQSIGWNNRSHNNNKIWWGKNQEECILTYLWDEAYCWTWVWNKNTLSRILDREVNTNVLDGIWMEEYSTFDKEIITIREYLDTNESEIRADLQELDRILSMDYYLPDDKVLQLLPQYLQWYTRGSMLMLIYYTDKEDWEMVDFIIKMNYKSVDIMNHLWCLVSTLISAVLQDYVDNTVNSVILLFPEDLRLKLAKFYEENMRKKDDIIHEMAKWEYILWNEVRETEFELERSVLTRYPIYSKKDTKRFMLYAYSLLYNDDSEKFAELWENIFKKFWYSLYNLWWTIEAMAIMPRTQWYNGRIDWNLWHKKALIENLKSGEYKVWFNEKQWNSNHDYYIDYRLPTDEELAE